MPEIERDKLKAMLQDAQAGGQDPEALLVRLKARGYTLPGQAAAPKESVGHPADAPDMTEMPPGGIPVPTEKPLEELPLTEPLAKGLQMAGTGLQKAREMLPDRLAPLDPVLRANEYAAKGMAALLPQNWADVAGLIAAPQVGEIASQAGKATLKAVRPIVATTGDVLAHLAGHATGKHPELFKAAFKDPQILQQVTEAIGSQEQANFVRAVQDGIERIGDKFEAVQNALAGFGGQEGRTAGGRFRVNAPVKLKPAGQEIAAELVRSGHRLPQGLTGKAPLAEGVFAADSPEYARISSWVQKLQEKDTRDFGEALNLRRQLDHEINWGPAGGQGIQLSDKANGVLRKMRDRLDKELEGSLDPTRRAEWKEVNRLYSDAMKAKSELKRTVAGETPEQTAARVVRVIKSGRTEENLTAKASRIGDEAVKALDLLHQRVVSRELRDWTSGRGLTAAGALAAHGNYLAAPLALAAGSPRGVGYAAAGAGAMRPLIDKVAAAAAAHPAMLGATVERVLARHLSGERMDRPDLGFVQPEPK